MTEPRHPLVFQTRLKPSTISEYERVHATIPVELAGDIRGAGCDCWKIFRDGTVLTHVLRVVDPSVFFDALDHSSAHARWQQTVGPLLDPEPLQLVTDAPADPGSLVWRLPGVSE